MPLPSEHRHVENTEDFTEWGWGDKPSGPVPSDEIVVELFKEWADDIASQVHEKGCASGAATVLEELAKNGFFVLEGITDKGLLVAFQGTDNFVIGDELDIVARALDFDDPQEFSAHLRRLADAIDAGCQQEQSPSAPSA